MALQLVSSERAKIDYKLLAERESPRSSNPLGKNVKNDRRLWAIAKAKLSRAAEAKVNEREDENEMLWWASREPRVVIFACVFSRPKRWGKYREKSSSFAALSRPAAEKPLHSHCRLLIEKVFPFMGPFRPSLLSLKAGKTINFRSTIARLAAQPPKIN
jgi:hypothetical protein